MDILNTGNCEIAYDAEATRRAHADMASGGAEKCECVPCKNFAAQKPVGYPTEFLSLLERLGIDRDREIEVYVFTDNDPEGLDYCGWFYFVGSVLADGPREQRVENNFAFSVINGPAFEVAQFKDGPVSRIEFGPLRLPWVAGFSASERPGG